VTLFSTVSQSVNAQLTTKGFTFSVRTEAPGFSSSLDCALRTSGYFAMDFSVLLDMPADLGQLNGVPLGRLQLSGTHLAASLVATVAPALSIAIDGSFGYQGVSYALPQIRASVAYSSLAAVPQEIFRQLSDEAASVFSDIRTTASRYLELAAAGLLAEAADPGSVLRQGYGYAAGAAVTAMRQAGYDPGAIGDALRVGYGYGAALTAQVMRSVGATANEVGVAVSVAYKATAQEVGAALAAADYPASVVALTLRDIFGRVPGQVAGILASASISATDTAGALYSAFGVTAEQAAALLSQAGYGVAAVTVALAAVFSVAASQITSMLQRAGYSLEEIALAITGVWQVSPDELARYLAAGGYQLDQIGRFIQSFYQLNPEQLGRVLEAAGFPRERIADFFITLGGAFAEAVKKLDPTTW
jgi:hypothetical protein